MRRQLFKAVFVTPRTHSTLIEYFSVSDSGNLLDAAWAALDRRKELPADTPRAQLDQLYMVTDDREEEVPS